MRARLDVVAEEVVEDAESAEAQRSAGRNTQPKPPDPITLPPLAIRVVLRLCLCLFDRVRFFFSVVLDLVLDLVRLDRAGRML